MRRIILASSSKRAAALPGAVAVVLACLLFASSVSPVAIAAGDSPISVSSVAASFFLNPSDSGAFTASPSTAVSFTQDFPSLNFNTPADTVKCSQQTGVSPSTQPFTDVVPQPDGSCQMIVAQGNKLQAATGDMRNFQAVFTGSFQVAAAGRITFNIYSDDGWILSIGPNATGAQPGYVSGPMLNFPRVGPFTGYTIVGSYNLESGPNQNNLVVGFPAAGTYQFELDYSDCCEGTQALTVLANGVPIPPTSDVQPPQPTSVPPTLVPTADTSVTPVPTEVPAGTSSSIIEWSNIGTPLLIAAGAIALLVLASVGVYLFFWLKTRKKKPAPTLAPVVAEVVPATDDHTEFIGHEPENLTMVSSRRQQQQQVLPRACLLVKPDREIELSRLQETVIGRDSSNAAYVDDRQVSRHHARIALVDGNFWIEDLNSTNGTRVNGTTVTRQKLANNDQISVGDTTMTFAIGPS